MHCPRCKRELPEPPPPSCGECGAPLRLGEEPPPARLDTPVPIDRRGPRPAADPRVHGPDPALLALERSQWDLRLAGPSSAAAAPEPAFVEPDALLGPAPEDDGLPEPEVDALEIHVRRPATWRRALAGALDAAPFGVGGVVLARTFVRQAAIGLPAPPTGLDGLIDLVARERGIVLPVLAAAALAYLVYATLAHALAGATLGKRLLGLRLVGPDGERPSLGRSAARSAMGVLSVALLGMGLLLAVFSRSGRALHDLAARTWVVERPPADP